ncbi:hypothetical protein CAEBREN_17483 [Caenorhabditis brenneri]|uniref:Uncharacterized protein n=1 Tax=Caenorhabditis brenneri TaxID=135651 RepID=G0NK51_CAEBE|nr:hypothetical protein CAEBREN_17483 [Caenorhabditis brenneri]
MVEMDQKVLGLPAKKHALILSGVFGSLFVLMVAFEIWKLPRHFEAWLYVCHNLARLSLTTPIFSFLASMTLLCLLKCNAKVLVIICILWPVSIAITVACFIVPGFSEAGTIKVDGDSLPAYGVIGFSIILFLGSLHCIFLLFSLGFLNREGGGVDNDLYDLEKSDSREGSDSSSSSK